MESIGISLLKEGTEVVNDGRNKHINIVKSVCLSDYSLYAFEYTGLNKSSLPFDEGSSKRIIETS